MPGRYRPKPRHQDGFISTPIADRQPPWHRSAVQDRFRIIEKSDGDERVVICRREDGNFSYRRQWADASVIAGDDPGWGPLGPELGIYDSPETAETEAMQRVSWLKASFH